MPNLTDRTLTTQHTLLPLESSCPKAEDVCFCFNYHPGTIKWLNAVAYYSDNRNEHPDWDNYLSGAIIRRTFAGCEPGIFYKFVDRYNNKPCTCIEDGLWVQATPEEVIQMNMQHFIRNRSLKDPPCDGDSKAAGNQHQSDRSNQRDGNMRGLTSNQGKQQGNATIVETQPPAMVNAKTSKDADPHENNELKDYSMTVQKHLEGMQIAMYASGSNASGDEDSWALLDNSQTDEELDFDDSEASRPSKPSTASIDTNEPIASAHQHRSSHHEASPRQSSSNNNEGEDDYEQSRSVFSENDALYYRARATPHEHDDGDEGSRFSASESGRRSGGKNNGDGYIYCVTDEVLSDPFGDQGIYSGFMSSTSGFPHGHGTMVYQTGRRYEGEWNHGQWHGRGRSVNPNGDTYQGEFDHDARHGFGRYKWANDNVYEGEFFEDKRHGQGTFTYANGNVYKGEFVNGLFEGAGRYEFKDGFYQGEWRNNRYEGQGQLQYLNGSRHHGRFVAGVAHGKGVAVDSQGNVRRGNWENGKPVV